MKPGLISWATNDVYAAGPETGEETKVEPSSGQSGDGHVPGDRPAPRPRNWLFNRLALASRILSRMFAMTWIRRQDPFNHGIASVAMGAACHTPYNYGAPQTAWAPFSFLLHTGTRVEELLCETALDQNGPQQYTVYNAGTSISSVGIDSDGGSRRIVVIEDPTGSTDLVYYNTVPTAGGWTGVTWSGGAPGTEWNAVGCDRGVTGGPARWIIGGYAILPGNASVWTSTDGVTFSNLTTFPTTTAPIRGIFHTRHPSGALGPAGSGSGQDPGNASWLVLTDTQAIRSLDGSSWTSVAHGLANGMGARCAAYSRVSGKWMIPLLNASGRLSGDVAYSLDLGANWSTLSGVLAPLFTSGTHIQDIQCDQWGTWMIHDGDGHIYVSTDDGETWTFRDMQKVRQISNPASPAMLQVGMDHDDTWKDSDGSEVAFLFGHHTVPTTEFETISSLSY